MLILHEVMRLPAKRTVVALYMKGGGGIETDHFYFAVCSYLRSHQVRVQDYPDDATIYREWWREQEWRGETRIRRCRSTDPGAYPVMGIDLKRWGRSRKPKE